MSTTIRRVVLTGVLAALAGAQAWAVTFINTCPFVITVPGNYVVTKDLLPCPNGGIYIQVSHVTVNLNGHIIAGLPAEPVATGISVNPGAIPHLNQIGISGPGLIQGFSTGISIQDSDYVQVSLTAVAGNAAGGISASNVTYLTVGGNVIAGSPSASGLVLQGSAGAQVTGNQMVGNNGAGILLNSGNSNVLTGNVASGNAGGGIVLGPGPLSNSRVSSNTTNGNGKAGIWIQPLTASSLGNEIFSNTSSVGNLTWDLEDDNAPPPCGTDFWSSNVFLTKNPASCIN